MSGLLGKIVKRIDDRLAAYAARQAQIVRHALAAWHEAMKPVRPVRVRILSLREAQLHRLAWQRAAARHDG
ncbi:hypothetical protein [Bosea minatitlanensis]|uniref:Uncharacterized protein n=1 Tax=Bosea minatitlanensis TaxID=128782 RepID=A0ABW0F409_9HYPH|nr:hypothetical protein [Bosea minatitlanensis]MCT4493488.1 hypothetical protein [Bosea minatitlanensis]